MDVLNEIEKYTEKLKNSETFPVYFIGHGNPMNAITNNSFTDEFKKIATTIPTPQAILCISAHWYTKGTYITGMKYPKTIHDFGGFPKELYAVKYPAEGNLDLANTTKSLLLPTEVSVDMEDWGLDHGTWSILRHIYPDANIPVVQLSIDYTKPLPYHYEIAQRLKSLRNKGVLIIGSGNIVHNLRMVDWQNLDTVGYGYDWAIEFQGSINQIVFNHDFNALINPSRLPKSFKNSVPTPDHYLPLIYSVAQSSNDNILTFNDTLIGGSLSMTSYKFDS